MATLAVATWALGLQYSNLTAGVIDAASKSLYNWAGCAIGGFNQTAPSMALEVWKPFGGQGTSSIFGTNATGLVDAQTAALVNGIASHIDDYDDTHLATIIHPTGPVASALFAITEQQSRSISGPEFITAFVAGVEAELKLGLAVSPQHYDVGWHITSTTGSIGAAVAVGKLLSLNTSALQQAIGIAATQVTGMQVYFGTDTKSFHIGRAAQNGLLAALLARAGYSSSLEGLEAKYGWAHVVSTRENLTAEFDTLGKTWEIERNTFKPFPCGIVIHPTLDGAIQIHDETAKKGIAMSSLKSLHLRVNPEVLTLTGKTDPQTGLEGKFSVYHAAAVALLYGQATPPEFTDAVVKNATVIATRKKVSTTVDNTVKRDQANLTATFNDGTVINIFVKHTIGSLENPLSVAQLKKKFVDQATRVIGPTRAIKAYEAFTGLQNATDVTALFTTFAP